MFATSSRVVDVVARLYEGCVAKSDANSESQRSCCLDTGELDIAYFALKRTICSIMHAFIGRWLLES